MPTVNFKNFTGGMTPDVPPHLQTDREFLLLENYRVQHRGCEKILGQQVEITGMPISDPNVIYYYDPPTQFSYFATALGGNAWLTYGNTNGSAINTDLTDGRQIANIFSGNVASRYKISFDLDPQHSWSNANLNFYTTGTSAVPISTDSDWTAVSTGGGFNLVLNNPQAGPFYVVPTGAQSLNLQQLPGWHKTSANGNVLTSIVTADVMCSFKSYLLAGNISVADFSGNTLQPPVNYPSTIRISDFAVPGGVPLTWVPGTNNFADEFELSTTDPIQDLVPARDGVLAFTRNQCFVIGTVTQSGTPVTALSQVRGLLNKRCAVSVDGLVYFLSQDDIMVTSGAPLDFRSLVQTTFRNYFFEQRLNRQYFNNAFGRYNRYFNEVIFFYPNRSSTDGKCNEAIIYNVTEQSWTQRSVPPCLDATYAPTSGNQSGANTQPWTGFNTTYSRLHSQVGNTLYVHDTGYSYLGVQPIATTIQKVFDLEPTGADAKKVKKITQLYPYFFGNTVAEVKFVFSDTPFSNVSFADPDYTGSFDSTIDYKIDAYREGRFIAMQITTNDQNYHSFNSFAAEIEVGGQRG